ncbi:MAG: hypothetical protein QOG63_1873 [Thermoleophilaceae bacterium]|jgi:hypothetical protein|nr:hypothetical protein [Thermoleophilaceae bacterium]
MPTDLHERLTRSSAVTPAADEGPSTLRTILTRPVALLLVALMALGSVFLWIVVPVGWLWIASHATETSAPTLGPYLLVIFAIPVTMFVVGKLLFKTNRLYERVTGRDAEVRVQMPWHKSLRDSSTSGRRTTVLDVVMISSVAIALTAFGVWFFLFAGSSIPGN